MRLACRARPMSADQLESITANALEWINGAKPPYCLLHIARCEILCAMSGRSLPSALEALGLPWMLQRYLAYYII